LGVGELSEDWYRVFRAVTRFRTIERSDLQKHSDFGSRLKDKSCRPIGTINDIKGAGIAIAENTNKFGIPQGTPISSALSNVYLLDFDATLLAFCTAHGCLYQRYSDDILVICPLGKETDIIDAVEDSLKQHHIELAADKTDRQKFDMKDLGVFQYLGFNISPDGAVIRPSSLARQWRKFKRAINTAKRAGLEAISSGKSDKIYVSNLRRRFSPVGARNFSSYARRADKAFGKRKITSQIGRLERRMDAEIRALQKSDGT
jgi:hypothetical protein